MNEWGIYIAVYCVLLYTQSTLQSYEGVSPQPPPVCSIYLDDVTAATGQRHQCAHYTPATGGEEREIEPIKWIYWETLLGKNKQANQNKQTKKHYENNNQDSNQKKKKIDSTLLKKKNNKKKK